jgi:hypothetical protein
MVGDDQNHRGTTEHPTITISAIGAMACPENLPDFGPLVITIPREAKQIQLLCLLIFLS